MLVKEEEPLELNFVQVKCDPFNPPNSEHSYGSNEEIVPDNDGNQSCHSVDEDCSEENVLVPAKRKLRNRLVAKLELVDIMRTNRGLKEMFPLKKKCCRQKSPKEKENETIVVKKVGVDPDVTRTWKCLQYDLVLKNQQKYEMHMEKRHPDDKRIYKCSIEDCAKGFEKLSVCKRHELTHLPDEQKKIHQCPHCDQKFSQKTNMLSHVRSVHIKVKVCALYHASLFMLHAHCSSTRVINI